MTTVVTVCVNQDTHGVPLSQLAFKSQCVVPLPITVVNASPLRLVTLGVQQPTVVV